MRNVLLAYRGAPRWIIQCFDLFIAVSSFVFSYFLVKKFDFPEISRTTFFLYTGVYTAVTFIIFYLFKLHKSRIRYSNSADFAKAFFAVFVVNLSYGALVYSYATYYASVSEELNFWSLAIPLVLVVDFFIASCLLILFRTAIKETLLWAKRDMNNSNGEREKVLIYGSDMNAVLLKNAIETSVSSNFYVTGFLDNFKRRTNTSIEQKNIFNKRDLPRLKAKHQVDKLIVINKELGAEDKKALLEYCLGLGIQVSTVPRPDEWAYGKLSLKQIKKLNIEDLLQREPIVIHNDLIKNEFKGKRVLITGAAGSIGCELVHQVLSYQPASVIICDQAETALHETELTIQEKFPSANVEIFIGNIQNYKRMEHLYKRYHPQVVFHAAAYKHVPMMESHPSEAVLTNILGTKNIADLAVKYQVERFVMISTDKAVNPTNIMGASKRIAEMYVQSLNNTSEDAFEIFSSADGLQKYVKSKKTKFITTRFGNVLGSNGSVLPLFQTQIQKGGPVTVTHEDITRFFMTIPEAVQLVLEAATMGQGGEIYVFDMGSPVRIADMAKQMIKLAGLEEGKDIKIEYTGLRPGEKLFEELLNDRETTSPTHHEKIKIARMSTHDYEQVFNKIEELIILSNYDNDMVLVQKMKDIVPEFVSNNSQYQRLDITKKGEEVKN